MKNFFISGFCLLIIQSCTTSPVKKTDNVKDILSRQSKNNVNISFHFKNETDKSYCTFQQYDEFCLEEYGIVAPPPHTTANIQLGTTIKLELPKPALLLFGLNEFYIEPNDSVEIDYTVLKHSKYKFSDSIFIKKGFAAVTLNNGNATFLNKGFANSLQKNTSMADLKKVFSEQELHKAAILALNNMYSSYPYLKKSKYAGDFLLQHFEQSYFRELITKFKAFAPGMTNDTKSNTALCISNLSILLSQKWTIKLRRYWYSINTLYEQIIDEEFKKGGFSLNEMKKTIDNYDETTKQFFLLLAVKNNYHLPDSNNNNMNEIIEAITFSQF